MYKPLTNSMSPNRASAISDASDDLLGRRVGGYSPALVAKFRGMDEAMAQGSRTARASGMQSAARSAGAFGPASAVLAWPQMIAISPTSQPVN